MNKTITQLRWLAATIMLVAAMVMPSTAWAQDVTYTNGFGSDGSYQEATLTTDQYDIDGDDTKDEVYEIGNAGQLYWFAALVNGTDGLTQNLSANAVLIADITLNSSLIENLAADGTAKADYEVRSWMPISPDVNYSGTFDGDNHTIRGLYYNVTSSDTQVNAGLFGRNAGTIKNVSVKGSYFKLNFGGKYCIFGILCGFNAGTIENCYNESAITLTGTVLSVAYFGGICGDNGGNGIIKNCNNVGKVSSEASCSQPIIYVGGVSGINSSGTIENSSNTGEVSGICNVGGVCGYNYGSSTIESCHNTGEVIGTEGVGGVCGKVLLSKITNCYNTNTGKVTGSSYVGGVCGEIEVYGGTATIENCYNAWIVSGTGGVCGGIDYHSAGTVNITNNYYLSETPTNDGGKTEAQFKSGEVCYLLNGSTSTNPVWYQLLETETYPSLDKTNSKNRTVYQCNPCTAFYSNTEGVTKNHNHVNDGNGFLTCTACGDKRYQQATLNESGEYEIGNAGQLYWFAGLVNGTLDGVTRNKSANAVLTNNITVNEGVLDINGNPNSGTFRNWTPIGVFEISTWTGYSGIFDGKNYTINGLYFNNTSTDFVGLFSSSNGTIKNVGVTDSYFNGLGDVGGLCGYNVNGRIENCYTTSSVNGTTYIGGVCGQNDDNSKILNCYNLGAVS